MKYTVIFAAFDGDGNFSQEEIDNEEGNWGISYNGKTPSEEEFLSCKGREHALKVKNALVEYNDSLSNVLKSVLKNTYEGNDSYEAFWRMTWHPD